MRKLTATIIRVRLWTDIGVNWSICFLLLEVICQVVHTSYVFLWVGGSVLKVSIFFLLILEHNALVSEVSICQYGFSHHYNEGLSWREAPLSVTSNQAQTNSAVMSRLYSAG